MRARSSLMLSLDPAVREALIGAMGPETVSPPDGTNVDLQPIEGRGPCVLMTIESQDLSSHRAALNSYLGLMQASIGSLQGPFEKNKYEERTPGSGG